MSDFVSRGFQRRRGAPDELAERLPPGQYVEPGYPVLTAGPTPHIAKATISLIALGHEPGRVLHEAFGPTGV